MKIIICDDKIEEILEIKSLCSEYLAKRGLAAEIEETTNPEELLKRGDIDGDILILDVEMGEVDGIEVKDRLAMRGDSPLVIFATSHPEVMPQAFNVNVVGFLQKPVNAFFFAEYMDSAVNILTAGRPFDYPDGSKGSTADILWIESERGYADVHLTDGTVRNLGKRPIKELTAQLEPFGFICINSGLLVNCKYIDEFSDDKVLLQGVLTKSCGEPKDVTLTVSRRRKKDCWEKYVSYCERLQKYT